MLSALLAHSVQRYLSILERKIVPAICRFAIAQLFQTVA